jgi:CheY-like chemotaxis protein
MSKVLIIEDDSTLREDISFILSLDGHNVISASTGLEGVDCAKQYLPDVILCDILIPEIDGYEVLKRIRSTPQTASIFFVFLSGIPDLKGSNQLGAHGYLLKPFTIDQLLSIANKRLYPKN